MRINLILAVMLSMGTLFGAGPHDTVDVIVRFKNPSDQSGHRRFIHKRSLDLVNAHVYTVNASDPDVEYIGLDHPIQAMGNLPTQPDYGWMTALGVTFSTATLAWDGTGIGVAVIDSGIVDNLDFGSTVKGKSRIVQANFVAGAPVGPAGVSDAYGTMVPGLIGGNGSQSTGAKINYTVRGIEPNVNIISLPALDNSRVSTDSTVITTATDPTSGFTYTSGEN